MEQRIDRGTWYLELAKTAAKRSSCPRLAVGAILVVKDSIVGVSYNGAPKGEAHCAEAGCIIDEPNYGPHCIRATHAEQNLLLGAAREGISTDGGIVIVTHYPCTNCMKSMKRAGIAQIYYGEDYHNHGTTYGMWVRKLVDYPAHQVVRNFQSMFPLFEGPLPTDYRRP